MQLSSLVFFSFLYGVWLSTIGIQAAPVGTSNGLEDTRLKEPHSLQRRGEPSYVIDHSFEGALVHYYIYQRATAKIVIGDLDNDNVQLKELLTKTPVYWSGKKKSVGTDPGFNSETYAMHVHSDASLVGPKGGVIVKDIVAKAGYAEKSETWKPGDDWTAVSHAFAKAIKPASGKAYFVYYQPPDNDLAYSIWNSDEWPAIHANPHVKEVYVAALNEHGVRGKWNEIKKSGKGNPYKAKPSPGRSVPPAHPPAHH
ncbi:hypothetical protein C0991_010304 [Blastosporella zonata]|nr:hypothetical protein C0991_010304 [Blastosporella zonata]